MTLTVHSDLQTVGLIHPFLGPSTGEHFVLALLVPKSPTLVLDDALLYKIPAELPLPAISYVP
jgi:hypothetical protein